MDETTGKETMNASTPPQPPAPASQVTTPPSPRVSPTPPPAPYPQTPAPAPQPSVSAAPVQPPAPLTQLTGGMKFAWLLIGFFLSIPGMLLAWLVNADRSLQVRESAILFSVIGFIISFGLALSLSLLVFFVGGTSLLYYL